MTLLVPPGFELPPTEVEAADDIPPVLDAPPVVVVAPPLAAPADVLEPPTLLTPPEEAVPPLLDFPPVWVPASLVPASLLARTVVAEKDEQPAVSVRTNKIAGVEALFRVAKVPSIGLCRVANVRIGCN